MHETRSIPAEKQRPSIEIINQKELSLPLWKPEAIADKSAFPNSNREGAQYKTNLYKTIQFCSHLHEQGKHNFFFLTTILHFMQPIVKHQNLKLNWFSGCVEENFSIIGQ